MPITIPAVYEGGVFRPLTPPVLEEGQHVSLEVQPVTPPAELPEWCRVYEGLSEADIAEVEAIALDRIHFLTRPDEE